MGTLGRKGRATSPRAHGRFPRGLPGRLPERLWPTGPGDGHVRRPLVYRDAVASRRDGKLCAERGAAFIVDGSQGVGLLDLNVKAAGIRFMAFSGWKWLLGPLGLGVLYVDGNHLESLRPVFKGTESVPGDQEYLPYKHVWKPSADRFTLSTGSMTDWVYFDASLAYQEALGFARVRERIRSLARRLSDGLQDAGYLLHSEPYPDQAAGIVSAIRPGQDALVAVKVLKSRGIIAAARLGRIRLSPHVYISERQIDTVVAAMALLEA